MSNNTFKHRALDNPAQSIRLVHVSAQKTGTSLELRLSMHSVADTLSYFAVSYTWGDGRLTEEISINGYPMKITKNCLYSLEQINRRYPSYDCSREPTYLWIDSICINQNDDNEKGHQVAMMGNIYAKATKVLACIGPAADNSPMLRTLLDDIKIHNPQLYADRETLRSGYWFHEVGNWEIKNSSLQSYLQDSVVSQDELAIQLRKACLAFAERSYWSRVWIIQEFTALDRSGNDLEVLCGHDSFSKSEINLCFYIASFLYKPSDKEDVDVGGLFAHRIPVIRRHCFEIVMRFDASDLVPIGAILFRIRDRFHSTKPEDRVYGLLPLAEWPDGMPPIQPVYNTSSALDLAELLLSITNETMYFSWTILEALEIYHDYKPLRSLVESRIKIQDSHRTSRSGGKYPVRGSNEPRTAVLSLQKNNTGQLSASLDCKTSAPGSTSDTVAERAAVLHKGGGNDKPQVLLAGSRTAGLLCGEAREGDVIMHHELNLILVLRPSNHNSLYRLVGQGLFSDGFRFPQGLPLSKGVLEAKLEEIEGDDNPENKRESLKAEIETAYQPGQTDLTCKVELRAEPIEWLIWMGQDLSRYGDRDEESMFKRLSTTLFMEATIV